MRVELVRRAVAVVGAIAVLAALVALGAMGRPTNGAPASSQDRERALAELLLPPSARPASAPAPTPAPTGDPAAVPYAYPALARPALPLSALGVDAGTVPTAKELAALLDPLLRDHRLGGRVGIAVTDPATGKLIYERGANQGYVPASTTKLLTAAAALSSLGPDRRLATTVVRTGQREIVLVGGGDPSLVSDRHSPFAAGYPSPPHLATLAKTTAKALTEAGMSKIRLGYHAGRYAGPRRAASWAPSYLAAGSAVVAPVSALIVDRGFVGDPANRVRNADPARQAAELFAAQLRAEGIALTGPVSATVPDRHAPELARVVSAPMSALVEEMLVVSDNDIAEILGREIALATGHSASFDGAAAAIRKIVAELGIDVSHLRLLDASGLSRANAIPPGSLAALLAVAARPDQPRLRPVLAGLAVAGFSGTLADRVVEFVPPAGSDLTAISSGQVRAKSGTLTGVRSLAGYVRSASGRLLMFAVIADRLPSGDGESAELVLDAIAAALSACCPG